ncbi:hypothetical protein F5X99DRAFT_385071 [Biscogniauxia marginata]|nr:hypothetical protein F5X99DRAFT_385071 [Biscogniauxia marginata]
MEGGVIPRSPDRRLRPTRAKSHQRTNRINQHRHLRQSRRQVHITFRKGPIISSKTSTHNNPSLQCLSANDTNKEDIAAIMQAVSYMSLKQEQLLVALTPPWGNTPDNLYKQPSTPRYVPSFDLSISSTLHRYFQVTVHPDPLGLCDFFLAKYSLPHILSGSYDPIELIHMHGLEPEDSADTFLVLQFADGRDIEIPWNYIDQAKEPHLALRVAQVAWLIRELWLQQSRPVRAQDESDVSLETDEFADPFYLDCPADTKVILYHSTYDSSGAHTAREPWLSPKRSLLCQLQPCDDRLTISGNCPWERQVFHDTGLISFACIYLVLSQMSITGDISQRIMGNKKALRFLSRYSSKCPRFMPTNEIWVSPNWTHFHFHLRVLSMGKKYLSKEFQRRPYNGLRPSRVSGRLTSLGGTGDLGIIEERFAIALVTSQNHELPIFTIVYLSDSGYRKLFIESERSLDIPSRGQFTSIAVYLRLLRSILPLWKRKWVGTLNEVDNLVGVKIDDLFNPEQEGAMFDSTFERSRLYFRVLETLRVFSEWIQESQRELERLRSDHNAIAYPEYKRRGAIGEDNGKRPSTPFMKEINDAWEELINFHSATSKSLLDRIEKKNEEIKSYKDGLFSATSAREASRATVLNQYILVFTFVTIFYLPLNYVSSLFNMDIFFHDDPQRFQSSFLISTALIAIITWIVSGLVLWVVHDEERLHTFRELWNRFGWANSPRRHEVCDEKQTTPFQEV